MYKVNILTLLSLIISTLFAMSCEKSESDEHNLWSDDEVDLNSKRWELVWAEEFDKDYIDTTNWTVFDSYWQKNPKCLYKPEQITVENGNLVISAIKNGDFYQSGRMQTAGDLFHTGENSRKVEFGFGKLEFKVKMPKGAGLKTAIWMLGTNKAEVGWPKCGEIDIVEQRGFEPNVTKHNIHWYNENEGKKDGNGYTLNSENELTGDWHVFTLIRDDKKISYYMDGSLLNEYILMQSMSEFLQPFYFIIQLDIGKEGSWVGPVDPDLTWPKKLYIDYVRYYQMIN
ncbi:MAG: glycoside hydrolase family 16 protein [Bacteroidota bacterium]